MVQTSAIDTLEAYVREAIGSEPGGWPGGYPNDIEAALFDAIYSVRAKYGSRVGPGTGVFAVAYRWREYRDWSADDLQQLSRFTADEVVAVVKHKGKLAGRLKAEVVVDAAIQLAGSGIRTAADLRANAPVAKSAYLSVKGCGPVTWAYLQMLVGLPGVKADTWVMRFVKDRIPNAASPEDAAALVSAVAERMDVQPSQLDHAIWSYRRAVRS